MTVEHVRHEDFKEYCPRIQRISTWPCRIKLNLFWERKLNKYYKCNPALTPQLTHAVSSPQSPPPPTPTPKQYDVLAMTFLNASPNSQMSPMRFHSLLVSQYRTTRLASNYCAITCKSSPWWHCMNSAGRITGRILVNASKRLHNSKFQKWNGSIWNERTTSKLNFLPFLVGVLYLLRRINSCSCVAFGGMGLYNYEWNAKENLAGNCVGSL